jgi:hypothetical protein
LDPFNAEKTFARQRFFTATIAQGAALAKQGF